MLLLDLRRHDEAVKLLRRAVKISKTAVGAKHPQHATALANLGGALTQLGRHSDARSYLQRAVAINTAALGDAHESTRGAVANLKACEAAIEQQQQRQSTG